MRLALSAIVFGFVGLLAEQTLAVTPDGVGRQPRSLQPDSERVVDMTEGKKAAFDKFVRNESRFRDHYRSHYADSGYDYNQYRPAYQHGFELALDPRYATMNWDTLELQARRTWDEPTMGLWDRYQDAVRYGWEQGALLERG